MTEFTFSDRIRIMTNLETLINGLNNNHLVHRIRDIIFIGKAHILLLDDRLTNSFLLPPDVRDLIKEMNEF